MLTRKERRRGALQMGMINQRVKGIQQGLYSSLAWDERKQIIKARVKRKAADAGARRVAREVERRAENSTPTRPTLRQHMAEARLKIRKSRNDKYMRKMLRKEHVSA